MDNRLSDLYIYINKIFQKAVETTKMHSNAKIRSRNSETKVETTKQNVETKQNKGRNHKYL